MQRLETTWSEFEMSEGDPAESVAKHANWQEWNSHQKDKKSKGCRSTVQQRETFSNCVENKLQRGRDINRVVWIQSDSSEA